MIVDQNKVSYSRCLNAFNIFEKVNRAIQRHLFKVGTSITIRIFLPTQLQYATFQ